MRTVTEGLEITQFGQHKRIQDEALCSLTISAQALTGSYVQSSTYTSVRFSSCVFYSCTFQGVSFNNCNFENCDFEFTHFKDCQFNNCTFINCNWAASSTRQSSFVDCELDSYISAMTESNNNVMEFTFACDLIAA
jgi:uncharacterized protein YjbI with pentapeptide repeats